MTLSRRAARRPAAILPGLGATLLAFGLASGPAPAMAEPLPLPQPDFQLKASLRGGGTLDLTHSQGKIRVEMSRAGVSSTIVGIFDLKGRRMLMMVPAMPNMAVEMDIPPEYAVGALVGEGQRTGGSATVAGESCDLWKVESRHASAIGPTTACITADGIALRTEVDNKGKPEVIYEVTSLTRAPQPPSRFLIPPGTQVIRPKGGLGGLPGLLGGGVKGQ